MRIAEPCATPSDGRKSQRLPRRHLEIRRRWPATSYNTTIPVPTPFRDRFFSELHTLSRTLAQATRPAIPSLPRPPVRDRRLREGSASPTREDSVSENSPQAAPPAIPSLPRQPLRRRSAPPLKQRPSDAGRRRLKEFAQAAPPAIPSPPRQPLRQGSAPPRKQRPSDAGRRRLGEFAQTARPATPRLPRQPLRQGSAPSRRQRLSDTGRQRPGETACPTGTAPAADRASDETAGLRNAGVYPPRTSRTGGPWSPRGSTAPMIAACGYPRPTRSATQASARSAGTPASRPPAVCGSYSRR